jgi:hypothetical protein
MAVIIIPFLVVILPLSAQQPQEVGFGMAAPGLPANCTAAGYMQDGGEEIHIGKTYSSTGEGVVESSVCVTNGGWLTLINPKITKKGAQERGQYAGQGVEASHGSVVNLLNAEIFTDTDAGNGLWATNEGSLIYMRGGSITTMESSGHGVDTTERASIILYDVNISTSGESASGALVNDSGDGTVYARRVTAHTKGPGSPGFYMIGTMSMLTLLDCRLEAETSDAGVLLNGSNVTVTDSVLIGGKGVKLAGGTFTMTGGSLTATDSDAFYIGGAQGPDRGVPGGGALGGLSGGGAPGDARGGGAPGAAPDGARGGAFPGGEVPGGARGGGAPGGGTPPLEAPGAVLGDFRPPQESSAITVKGGCKISASTGIIVNVAEALKATFTADGTDLTGDMIVAEDGELAVTLTNSTLTGTVNGAAMKLDTNSKWNVTGDSVLTSLSNTGGISGKSITNIYGNGHTVYYDKKLSENKALDGKSYKLNGGGNLKPAK